MHIGSHVVFRALRLSLIPAPLFGLTVKLYSISSQLLQSQASEHRRSFLLTHKLRRAYSLVNTIVSIFPSGIRLQQKPMPCFMPLLSTHTLRSSLAGESGTGSSIKH